MDRQMAGRPDAMIDDNTRRPRWRTKLIKQESIISHMWIFTWRRILGHFCPHYWLIYLLDVLYHGQRFHWLYLRNGCSDSKEMEKKSIDSLIRCWANCVTSISNLTQDPDLNFTRINSWLLSFTNTAEVKYQICKSLTYIQIYMPIILHHTCVAWCLDIYLMAEYRLVG